MRNVPSFEDAKRAIHAAFADAIYPGDHDIAYNQEYNPSDGWRCAQIFKGKRWQDIEPSILLQCISMGSFTAAAFRYYLPAYMIGKLLHPDEVDVAGDFVIYGLVPPRDERSLAIWRERFTPLTNAQKSSVRMFLEAMASDVNDSTHAAQTALDEYWSRSQ